MLDLLSSGMMEFLRFHRKPPKIRARRKRRRFKQRIYWRDRGLCAYCDKRVAFDKSTLDHVQPLCQGGSDRHKENFVISCQKCNAAKGALILEFLDDLEPDKLKEKFEKNCVGQ